MHYIHVHDSESRITALFFKTDIFVKQHKSLIIATCTVRLDYEKYQDCSFFGSLVFAHFDITLSSLEMNRSISREVIPMAAAAVRYGVPYSLQCAPKLEKVCPQISLFFPSEGITLYQTQKKI